MRSAAGGRLVLLLALFVAGVAGALLLAGMLDAALTQPFGAPRSSTPAAPAAPADGIIGWLFAKQAEFNIAMRGFLRQAKSDGSAIWALLGVSFLYGVFHAAGPGHGKAVISSYVVANEETWKRGVVLSFASAFLQAVVAIAFVGIARLLLNATQKMMCDAERVIEMASYALIVLVGLRLLWVKGRAMIGAVKMVGRPVAEVGAAVTRGPHDHRDHGHDDHGHHHDHGHDHQHHGHHHHHHHHAHEHAHAAHAHHHHDHAHHDHDHDHASAWGHAHAPEPQELAGPGGWRRGLSAVLAVGIRPCSGAIIVLVFAMAQGLFWAGAASTFVMALGTAITVATIATIAVTARSFAQGLADQRSSFGTLAIRGIEVAASLLIIAFGGLLLAGYMFSERLPLC